ncbi:hypothetical protein [Streptomyces sp. CB03238]|nr:hypothetical protein [Streptomyces sp. CB03238]
MAKDSPAAFTVRRGRLVVATPTQKPAMSGVMMVASRADGPAQSCRERR